MRLAGRGLPRPHGGPGDLFAVVQIAMPTPLTDRQKALFKELGEASIFDPRAHFTQERHHAG